MEADGDYLNMEYIDFESYKIQQEFEAAESTKMANLPLLHSAIKALNCVMKVSEIQLTFKKQNLKDQGSSDPQSSMTDAEKQADAYYDPPKFLVLDGRLVQVPSNTVEIKIKQCKNFTLPMMTFLPVLRKTHMNSMQEIRQRN